MSDPTNESQTWPLAYLITYRCYGTWLHGDSRGSVDRENRGFQQPYAPPNPSRERDRYQKLKQPPVALSPEQREVVEAAVKEVCVHRGRELVEVTARTNHVHVVVSAPLAPERVLNAFKSWSTRALRDAALVEKDAVLGAYHGSTRYLWGQDSVADAQRYVAETQQGERFNTEQNPDR